MERRHTPATVREALRYIPAALPRDEWARIGMAIKSEFPDDGGLALFDEWSQSAPEVYSASGVRECWRSIKAGGKVGIGTLFHRAQEYGFDLRASAGPVPVHTAAQAAQRERERAKLRREEAAKTEAAQAAAMREAQARWDAASDTGTSPYLLRKGVAAHGLRFEADGTLLVPLRDAEGTLWSVQRILPQPRDGGPDKLFGKGSRKSGLWHWIGAPGAAIASTGIATDTTARAAAVLAVGEGYATCASVHAATGWPVAVAIDAGNLLAVCRALRSQYPGALIVVCGDDDRATQARAGHNPGRKHAQAAAHAVDGLAIFPSLPAESLADGASDFNDMQQAVGLAAVADHLRAGVERHMALRQTPASPQQAKQRGPAGAKKPAARSRPGGAPAGAGGGGGNGSGGARADAAGASDDAAHDPFTVDDTGVYYHGRDRNGEPLRPLWLCSRLDVVAGTRDAEGVGWGYLLTFADPLGGAKQWAMPSRMLSGDGGEYRATLLHMGLRIAPGAAARNRLTEYIQTRRPAEYATCTSRTGWHPTADGGMAFVLPDHTIGDDAERIVFQSDNQMENTFRSRKDVTAWRERIGAVCAGNSRLVFAVSCAFAGPLLRLVGMESGGFHLRGDSSSGKTTALRVAASVYGGQNYMQRWRTTDNALEAIAAQHCDSLLILDELAQVDGRVAGECAYMLANEQSKGRMSRHAVARTRLAWRLLFLSAGELGLADHMAEGMKRARTGQEVRMADIPADAGAGLGAFDTIHDFADGAAYATYLAREAASCHGAAGHAWLQWLAPQTRTIGRQARARVVALTQQWLPGNASGQAQRVAARFAVVAVAGELATSAGLTGWAEGEAAARVRACFDAWMAARGGAGNGEVRAMLQQVRGFLAAHGEGRFTWWHRASDDHSAKTLQRAGFRRMLGRDGKPIKSDAEHLREYGERMTAADAEGVETEYFILPDVFRTEVCKGFDHEAVCRVLLAHGCLKTDKDSPTMMKPRLPGMGPTRCYVIPSAAINGLDV
ncbi:MAG: DUF927 domain-containing protein [Comamonadaceae bacterium]|nr:DUF927 domain-containing protein [Comamonadaceae bacterium]